MRYASFRAEVHEHGLLEAQHRAWERYQDDAARFGGGVAGSVMGGKTARKRRARQEKKCVSWPNTPIHQRCQRTMGLYQQRCPQCGAPQVE